MNSWQRRALNFEVKAIESILGIQFEGTTLEEKQAFAAKHKKDRIEVTAELLRQTQEDFMRDMNF